MKMKMLVAALLLTCGVTSTFAQESNCNENSSLSHEAVNAGNFKDAYAPCMAVLKDCPTLKFYTYRDAIKILRAFLSEIKDRNNADYQKYFEELMGVYDQEIKYLPELNQKIRADQQVRATAELGKKAVDYLTFAPKTDLEKVYGWLKESVNGDKGNSTGAVLDAYMNVAMLRVQADKNRADEFFQDYISATQYIDEAIAGEQKANVKKYLEDVKSNMVARFINSGVADCESLQNIYGPQVEANQNDSVFLKKAISVLKMMGCRESEAYFQASYYMYKIAPTADAAVGCAAMAFKKGDYDAAVRYFDEALGLETDNERKAEMAYATAGALYAAKKYSQAKSYCLKSASFNENYGRPYILLAQIYAANWRWSDDTAKNQCTFCLCVDKLQIAKAKDPSLTEEVNKLIGSYSGSYPNKEDLFFQGLQAGERITLGGMMAGESTTIRTR